MTKNKQYIIVYNERTFYNTTMFHQSVTQARASFADLIKKVKKEPALIIQKSNPVAVLISLEEFNKLNKIRIEKETENEKLRDLKELESKLPIIEISEEEAKSIIKAKNEVKDGKSKIMTVDEMMQEISS
ncbi:MAG: type II toxin-antitoxin system prevent-host-death family antitoxin [Minisyncoccales bacterium]